MSMLLYRCRNGYERFRNRISRFIWEHTKLRKVNPETGEAPDDILGTPEEVAILAHRCSIYGALEHIATQFNREVTSFELIRAIHYYDNSIDTSPEQEKRVAAFLSIVPLNGRHVLDELIAWDDIKQHQIAFHVDKAFVDWLDDTVFTTKNKGSHIDPENDTCP